MWPLFKKGGIKLDHHLLETSVNNNTNVHVKKTLICILAVQRIRCKVLHWYRVWREWKWKKNKVFLKEWRKAYPSDRLLSLYSITMKSWQFTAVFEVKMDLSLVVASIYQLSFHISMHWKIINECFMSISFVKKIQSSAAAYIICKHLSKSYRSSG